MGVLLTLEKEDFLFFEVVALLIEGLVGTCLLLGRACTAEPFPGLVGG